MFLENSKFSKRECLGNSHMQYNPSLVKSVSKLRIKRGVSFRYENFYLEFYSDFMKRSQELSTPKRDCNKIYSANNVIKSHL